MEFAEDEVGSWIKVDGIVVLDPCTLLVSKLAALHGRPQGESNNDAPLCQILVEVVPVFLAEIAERREMGQTEYDPVADAWRLWLVRARERFSLPLTTPVQTGPATV